MVTESSNLQLRFYFNSFMTGTLSYKNQSIDLQSKSIDWFLYDNGLRHERVKANSFANYPNF